MKAKHEILQSLIRLKNNIGFTFTFVFTLTLTLSVLITAFNINNALLFKPLPYPNADQLHLLTQKTHNKDKTRSGSQTTDLQIASYILGKELAKTAITYKGDGLLVSHPARPSLQALYTSYEWFELLAVPMYLGQGLTSGADLTDSRNEVVISFDTWQTYFPDEQSLTGQTLQFDDEFYTIVGVIAADFVEPSPFNTDFKANQIYLPFNKSAIYEAHQSNNGNTSTSNLFSLVKVINQSSVTHLQSQFSQLFAEFASNSSLLNKDDMSYEAELTQLSSAIKGDNYQITLIIFAGAAALLFIAMVNIINVYFSYIAKQQQMLAICASVGAKPRAIFKKLFLESLLLTLSSTCYALLLAIGFIGIGKSSLSSNLPRMEGLGLDTLTVIFSITIALLLSAILAWLGSRLICHLTLKEQLNSSGKGTSIQISKKTRSILTMSQTTLTGLLLLCTSLVISSTLKLVNTPLGFDAKNVINFQVKAGDNYTGKAKTNLMLRIKKQLNALPQVQSASLSLVSPINVGNYITSIYDENQQLMGYFGFNSIDENYFSLLEQNLIFGRSFSSQELLDQTKVVVIDDAFAQHYFGTTEVINNVIYDSDGNAHKVIGVVNSHFDGSKDEKYDSAYLYFPWNNYFRDVTVRLKESGSLSQVDVVEQLQQIDSSINVINYQSIESLIEKNLSAYVLASWVAISLSVFALILAGAGVYGVMHYSTLMRRYELGVRMALGAKQTRIIKLVIKDAFKPLLWGGIGSVILGTLLYLILSGYIQQLGQPNVLQIGAAMFALLLLSLAACYIPVKMIVTQDPTKALKNE